MQNFDTKRTILVIVLAIIGLIALRMGISQDDTRKYTQELQSQIENNGDTLPQ